MSAAADYRQRAEAKRAAGLHWEASRLETIARRVEQAKVCAPATIEFLTDAHEAALADIEREREFMGSSFDEALARGATIRAALEELGAL